MTWGFSAAGAALDPQAFSADVAGAAAFSAVGAAVDAAYFDAVGAGYCTTVSASHYSSNE